MKIFLTDFFDYKGMVHREFLPEGHRTWLSATFSCYLKMKRPIKGRRFASIEEIQYASLEEPKAIQKSAYQKYFEDWKKRWLKCIISEGG